MELGFIRLINKILISMMIKGIMRKEEISPELARVHAHLCGDGSVCIWKTKEKDRRFRAVIGYYNKNQKLLERFRNDFGRLFDVKMKMRKNRDVCVKSIRIYTELKERFGDFCSRKWRIPLEIKESNKTLKLEWMKSFFEDEAYNEKRYNRLKIKSMNCMGLKDIKEMLDSLGIKCYLTGPNCDSSFYLTIPQFDSIPDFEDFVKEPVRSRQGNL
jgi:hypothetical protein